MATLKFRTAHGYGYVCDVKAVEMGVRWDVDSDHFDRPDSQQKESGPFGWSGNTISHPFPHTDNSMQITEQHEAVELLIRRQHGSGYDDDRYEVHIVPAGSCWLMGDDGRTIDSLR